MSYHIRQYETITGVVTNYTQARGHTELIIGSLNAHYHHFTIAAETVQQGPFNNPATVTTLEAGEHKDHSLPFIYIYLTAFLQGIEPIITNYWFGIFKIFLKIRV